MTQDSFRHFVLEQLAGLDGLRCKRMFGGHGLYSGQIFFGIVLGGRLYFKTNPGNLQDYLDFQAPVLTTPGKQVMQNYREVTMDILEDAAQLTSWAQKAARP